jgi:hypothetical protein
MKTPSRTPESECRRLSPANLTLVPKGALARFERGLIAIQNANTKRERLV